VKVGRNAKNSKPIFNKAVPKYIFVACISAQPYFHQFIICNQITAKEYPTKKANQF